MPAVIYIPMKIMQDEVSGAEEPRIPERIRNPSIKVIIGIWRWIVGNHRRTFVIVIVVNNLRVRIRRVTICRWYRLFVRRLRRVCCPH
jgi:hypothetical protein